MDDSAPTKRPATPVGPSGERTRTRILDTAEELFAQAGPAAVTLRSIAAAADVNVAAVNYHFGSKEKLFEEMFLRRIAPLNEERLTRLAAHMANADGSPSLEAPSLEAPSLEAIVMAFVMPALRLTTGSSASARAIIVQYSLGRVLALPEVNRMLIRYYAQLREAFVAALRQALPHLTPREVVWRYYWMGGSLMVALAVPSGAIDAPDAGGVEAFRSGQDTMCANLIAFLVQGLRAPSGEEAGSRDSGTRSAAQCDTKAQRRSGSIRAPEARKPVKQALTTTLYE